MVDGPRNSPPEEEASELPDRTRLVLELQDATRSITPSDLSWLAEHISSACKILHATGSLRVKAVNDPEMAAAHEEFAGVPGTTDVLTFDLGCEALDGADPAGGVVLDTDILVCLDEATRQGTARGHLPRRELLLYVVHGVLHCMGHDDHDPEASRRMHAEEDRVLSHIGVGATFGAAERAGRSGGAGA